MVHGTTERMLLLSFLLLHSFPLLLWYIGLIFIGTSSFFSLFSQKNPVIFGPKRSDACMHAAQCILHGAESAVLTKVLAYEYVVHVRGSLLDRILVFGHIYHDRAALPLNEDWIEYPLQVHYLIANMQYFPVLSAHS